MFDWQQVMLLQIVVSSFMAIWYRKVAIKHKSNFFTTAIIVYFVVAFMGIIYSLINNNWAIPAVPDINQLKYALFAGLLIPVSWLLYFIIIARVGAFSAGIAQNFNFVILAGLGFVILKDPLQITTVVGGLFIAAAVWAALSINVPKTTVATNSGDNSGKLAQFKAHPLANMVIIIIAALALAFGLLFEKLALDSMGVWTYTTYGWSAQFATTVLIFLVFGRHEISKINPLYIRNAFIAGLFTAAAGGLFVYALSNGLLSSIAIASSAKVALTAVLAIVILKETNNIKLRLIALALTIIGLTIMF